MHQIYTINYPFTFHSRKYIVPIKGKETAT
jgi:hypothetical protein